MNTVYNKDCMEGMKEYPDKYFELAIVDPPYFIGPNKREFYGNPISTTNIKRKHYPSIPRWEVPEEEYFTELLRVSQHQIIWGINYYPIKNLGSGRIIWDKINGNTDYSDAEIAYCSKHNSVRLFRYMWNGMMQGRSIQEGHIQQGKKILNEKRIHPTQKPVKLYEWLLSQYADPGDKILDTHLGGGQLTHCGS